MTDESSSKVKREVKLENDLDLNPPNTNERYTNSKKRENLQEQDTFSSQNEILKMVFPGINFTESAGKLLTNFLNKSNENDLNKNILILKNLLQKSGNIEVVSESGVKYLIKETTEIIKNKQNNKSTFESTIKNRSFKSLITETDDNKNTLLSITTKDLIKYEFIYNFSIVYLDCFSEVPNPNAIINQVLNKKEFNKFTNFSSLVKKTPVNSGIPYLSDVKDKSQIYTNHLQVIRHNVYHHSDYKNPFNNTKQAVPVYGLGSLLGNEDVITVIGILILNEKGKYQIQDENAQVFLDCSKTNWDKAYFPAGCVVLCEGRYDSEHSIFRATYILQPPIPQKKLSFTEKLESDYFGAVKKIVETFKNKNIILQEKKDNSNKLSSNLNLSQTITGFTKLEQFSSKIKSYIFPINQSAILKNQLENLNPNIVKAKINQNIFSYCKQMIEQLDILIISNPNLSDPNVLDHIDHLFKTLETSTPPPCMVVFIGNFLPDSSFNSFKYQQNYFENLAEIIEKYSNINNNCIFTFIPGNDDIQVSSSFPQPSLAKYIIEAMEKKVKYIIPCSNPARFSIFGKEIVFFRDDLHKKLSRNSLGLVDKNLSNVFYLNTLFGQGSLAPLEQEKSARVWHLAYTMLYFPPPDYLIIADLTEDYINTDNTKTTFINPGNFSRDMSFILFNPLNNNIQPCKVEKTAEMEN